MIRQTVWTLCTATLALLIAAHTCAAGQVLSDAAGRTAAANVTAFVDVTVIPMDRERALPGQTVIVRDGIIANTGPASSVPVPSGATRIEAHGRYLLPGLAEMHAHVPPDVQQSRQYLEDIMFLYVANGITSIRGMLGAEYQLALRKELATGALLGPTFYVGAPSLNGNTAPTAEVAERLVRTYKSAGYDLLKIHPGVSLETWDRLVATAHEERITLAGHIPEAVGLRHALETGMQGVDHLDGYMEGSFSDENIKRVRAGERVSLLESVNEIDEAKLQALIQLTVERHVYNTPTLYIWENLLRPVNPEKMIELPEMKYAPRSQRQAWLDMKRKRGAEEPATAAAICALRLRILKKLHEAGAPILMGTDTPQMFNVPGFALQHEIRLMKSAGLTPFEVLATGTRNVAAYARDVLRLEASFGTVAVGNRADLVLLSANPLEDLEHLTKRLGVMVRGRWIPAEKLERGLAAMAARYAAAPE